MDDETYFDDIKYVTGVYDGHDVLHGYSKVGWLCIPWWMPVTQFFGHHERATWYAVCSQEPLYFPEGGHQTFQFSDKGFTCAFGEVSNKNGLRLPKIQADMDPRKIIIDNPWRIERERERFTP